MGVVIGVMLGLAVAFGPLAAFAAPLGSVADGLVTMVLSLLGAAVTFVPDAAAPAVAPLVPLLAATAPGLTAVGLVVAARASKAARRLVAGVVTVAVVAAWLLLPAPQALLFTAVAVPTVGLLGLATGVVLVIPMVTLATLLTVQTVQSVWAGTSPLVTGVAASLGETTGTVSAMTSASTLWLLVVSAMALLPFAVAARMLRR